MKAAERRELIRSRVRAGETQAEVARDLGVSRATVSRAMADPVPRKGDRAAYQVVGTRLTVSEIAALDAQIRSGGPRTRAAVMRQAARAVGQFYVPTSAEEAFLTSAEIHLRNLGGNLNQVARDLSASRRRIGSADPSAKHRETIYALKDDLAEIRSVFIQMLENSQVRASALKRRIKSERSEAFE